MTHRRLVSVLTLMAFIGCLFAAPVVVSAQSWQDNSSGSDRGMNMWNRSWGQNNGFNSGHGNLLKHIIPGLLGGVAGFFLGSQFGMIGKIVGAAAGFAIASWIVNKIWPGRDRYSYNDYSRDYSFGWRNQQQQNNGWGFGPWRGSETGGATGGDANLQALRDRWMTATRDYQSSLSGSDTAARDTARANFEAARNAYYGAIRDNYNR